MIAQAVVAAELVQRRRACARFGSVLIDDLRDRAPWARWSSARSGRPAAGLVDVVRDHEDGLAGLRAQMATTSSCRAPRVSASSAENGSSISSILGSMASARAMPTRCFMPPESCDRLLCSGAVEVHERRCTSARARESGCCDQSAMREETAQARRCPSADEPRHQRMALEDHGAVEARADDVLAVDDDDALARRLEPGQNVEDRRLAAAGMADDADELALCRR